MDHIKTLKKAAGFAIGLGSISLIIAIVIFIAGIYVTVAGPDSSLARAFAQRGLGDAEDMKLMGLTICVLAVLTLFSAIFNIAKGIIGFKAADGSCFTAAMVMGILALLGDSLSFVLSILNSRAIIIKGLYFSMSLLYVYCAHGTKQEYENAQIRQAVSAMNQNKTSTEEEAAKFFG